VQPEPEVAPLLVVPTSTPEPTATPTATPTLTPTPVPAPIITPTAEVQAVSVEVPAVNFLAEVPSLADLSTDVGVVGANFSLALGSLIVILAATTIFNATLKENADTISGAYGRVTLPLSGLAMVGATHAQQWTARVPQLGLVKPVGLLALTAVIYSALDPQFGFNTSSLVLILGLMAGLTFTTFLYEGGQVLFSARAFGLPAAIRAYPLAVAIAGGSVVLSRLVDLNPGVIFGFVAAAVFTRGGVGNREQGLIVYVPMLGLLAVSLIALALVGPLRDLQEARTSAWAHFPETVAVAVFVGGAQSVLLSLIPLTFNDGEKVWSWNRYAWISLAVPASFLFFHVIINRDGAFSTLSEGSGALIPLAFALVFLGVAVAMWLFFRLTASKPHNA
jgi:hypothetical protein